MVTGDDMIMNIGSTPTAIGRTAPEIVRSSSQKNHHPSHLVQTVLPVRLSTKKIGARPCPKPLETSCPIQPCG